MAVQSNGLVCSRLIAGVMVSKLVDGMDVRLSSLLCFRQVSALRRDDQLFRGVLTCVCVCLCVSNCV